MPLYVYNCTKCSATFNKFKAMSDRMDPTQYPCDECGGEVALGITAPAIGFEKVRPSGEFREVMKEMKKNVPGNALKDY